MTIDEVGGILGVPVNLRDTDAFHLTIEEYLHSLISLVDELARPTTLAKTKADLLSQARLAVNSVTLGDYERPIQISRFIKDIHAGFQILNLKNDSLRRRSDSIKYSVSHSDSTPYDQLTVNFQVKKVEDVVYDLSLRNLVPKAAGTLESD